MDANDDTQESPLDLEVHCVECDADLTLTDDTIIGIRPDRVTPGALCSPPCAKVNAQRWRSDVLRCRCGEAIVDERKDVLMILAGRILGCPACDWTGHEVRHFWPAAGAAFCGARVETGERWTTTTDVDAVTCGPCRRRLGMALVTVEGTS